MPLPKPPSKPATLLKQIAPIAAEPGSAPSPGTSPPAEARETRAPGETATPPPAARLALVDSKPRNGRKARPGCSASRSTTCSCR